MDIADPSNIEMRVELLRAQCAIKCDEKLARAVEGIAAVRQLAPHEQFIKQGCDDDDLFFLVRGEAQVYTHGHRHTIRSRGTHVGEMALLEPGAGRSASVFAGPDGATVFVVGGKDARCLGAAFPDFWFNIAAELSVRLRNRNQWFIQPNIIPKIFIASSGQAKRDLNRIDDRLKKENVDVIPWTDETMFYPSGMTLDTLMQKALEVDFAIMLATPDDLTKKNAARRQESWWNWFRTSSLGTRRTARDNVMLEYGLFSGATERERVFILAKGEVELPSDLDGLTCLRYSDDDTLDQKLNVISDRVARKGVFYRLRRSGML